MKHYPYISQILAAALTFFLLPASCTPENGEPGSSNGDGNSPFLPDRQVLNAFDNRYPEATDVVWFMENGYCVADFMLNSRIASAWFGTNGEWRLGKIPTAYQDVEPVVADALSHTAYAGWEVIETYTLNRKELATVYTLSVTNNHTLSNLYFTLNGDFIKVIDDTDSRTDAPVSIPTPLTRAIEQLFSNIEIVDVSVIDVINSEVSVGLLKDYTYLTAVFTKNYTWIVNFWNMTPQSLPTAVWEGFQASPYATLPLSRIRAMETTTATTYVFYLIRNEKTMIAEFNSSGRLTSVISRGTADHVMAKYLFII